jgi:hypothetical protein
MIRIAITAAAYAAIRESLPVAKSRRYAPQKAGGGLYLVSVPNAPSTSWKPCAGLLKA